MQNRVLVCGAGPAGLTAANELGAHGFDVTVFERESHAGGFVNLIPKWRFDSAKYVNRLLDNCQQHNIKIEYNRAVEFDNIENYLNEFDFIVIATGAQKPRQIIADFKKPRKVMYAVDYLKSDIRAKTVGVVGAGNVAVDCACTAVSRGAVTNLYYRRSEAEMRANKNEIEHGKKVGVKFNFMMTDFDIDVDILVIAIGFEIAVPRIENKRIFIAGDANTGSASIASAVLDAKRAALEIIKTNHA